MFKRVLFVFALVCALNLSTAQECGKSNFALSNFKNVYIFNFLCKGSGSSILDGIRGKICGVLPPAPKKAAPKKKVVKKAKKGELTRSITGKCKL